MSWLVTDMLFLHGELPWILSYGSVSLISTFGVSTPHFKSNLNCPENLQALLAELHKTRGLVWFFSFNGVVTLPSKETDCTSVRTTFFPIFTLCWDHNNLQEQIFKFLQKIGFDNTSLWGVCLQHSSYFYYILLDKSGFHLWLALQP